MSAEAIVKGIAGNGGLYVPQSIPVIDDAFITGLTDMDYCGRAQAIVSLFLTDYTAGELADCIGQAYGGGHFGHPMVAPVVSVQSGISVLELWHGPTSAFKDMALQLLPRLLTVGRQKIGETAEIAILTATSGDTGKAALEGFRDVPQTRIIVFYPHGGVSEIQRLQMVTQEGNNVAVIAVEGNFDDAQNGVKAIFGDAALNRQLADDGVQLSSANSINWGRLAPQIVYYFSAYADLVRQGTIQTNEKVNFVVPTGNFGNILAAYYAWKMGLPVHKLICAANSNNVLTDFLTTGCYDRRRPFHKTQSPSMDILISSNLERLLYHATDGDTARLNKWMEELTGAGYYRIDADLLAELQQFFWSGWADDSQTSATIKNVYETAGYTCDPHTAVAWRVADEYQRQTGDTRHMVVVSTASPFKFNEAVLSALGISAAGQDEFGSLDKLSGHIGWPVPEPLAALKHKHQRHQTICGKDDMAACVRQVLGK